MWVNAAHQSAYVVAIVSVWANTARLSQLMLWPSCMCEWTQLACHSLCCGDGVFVSERSTPVTAYVVTILSVWKNTAHLTQLMLGPSWLCEWTQHTGHSLSCGHCVCVSEHSLPVTAYGVAIVSVWVNTACLSQLMLWPSCECECRIIAWKCCRKVLETGRQQEEANCQWYLLSLSVHIIWLVYLYMYSFCEIS